MITFEGDYELKTIMHSPFNWEIEVYDPRTKTTYRGTPVEVQIDRGDDIFPIKNDVHCKLHNVRVVRIES